jgi:hypothetical protein
VLFVFSCILQVLEEKPIKFQDYNEFIKLTFGWIQFQINFEFKEREVGKNTHLCFLEEQLSRYHAKSFNEEKS